MLVEQPLYGGLLLRGICIKNRCPSLGALVVAPSLRCPGARLVPEHWCPSLGALVVGPRLRCPGARLVPEPRWPNCRHWPPLPWCTSGTLRPAGAPLVPKHMFGVHAGIYCVFWCLVCWPEPPSPFCTFGAEPWCSGCCSEPPLPWCPPGGRAVVPVP